MPKRKLAALLVAALVSAAMRAQAQPQAQSEAKAEPPASAQADAPARPRPTEPPKTTLADRLYVGVTAADLEFDDEYGGVALTDSSVGTGLLAGFVVNDRLTLEVSYDSFDAIDLHNVAGSGITHFDVETERRTVVLSALRAISMKELFGWPRDWRLFGTLGAYSSDLQRTVTTLGSSAAPSSVSDDTQGLLLGCGVLYAIGRMELRGYVRSFGVLDEGEASEMGAAIQFRF